MRPATLLGVAEAVACEVALGLSREAGMRTRVYAAPLSFGPGQLNGPLVDLIGAMLLGYPVPTDLPVQATWGGVYAPDLAVRVLQDLLHGAPQGDLLRVVGLKGLGWNQLVSYLGEIIDRFFMTNPSLKQRFPDARWTPVEEGIAIQHPGWPEQIDTGMGALVTPSTDWAPALAETVRWYLTQPDQWRETVNIRLHGAQTA